MLLFKRLLNFGGGKLIDKRTAQRHPVGPGFPLKGSVSLQGRDHLPKPGTVSPDTACNWAGRPANFSRHGLSLQLPPAAITVRGEASVLELSLEAHRLQIPCKVAHFRTYNSHSVCGLKLNFDNEQVETAYVQLLDTVAIGGSFTLLQAEKSKRRPTGLVREQYKAGNKFLLTAWREGPDRALTGFELLLGDYCVKVEASARELEIYSRESARTPPQSVLSAPAFGLSAGLHAEVRQLYRWLVLNLPKAVPADLRVLTERFIRKSDILAPAAKS